MPVALDRASYFASHLSDNIAETPEGFRICRNAVIGRSGFQSYKVSELTDPDGLLSDRPGGEEIQVWRDPQEVFSAATLASFEGKDFTVTHPSELLHTDSDRTLSHGHLQNVRKGTEPLESGDWPMLADIIVKTSDAIRAIDAGERELSCGYSYKLAREGQRFDQREILGNHVALVPKGRAGKEARINDAAPNKGWKVKKINQIIALGVATLAKTASPEELTEVIDNLRARGIATDADDADDKEKSKFVEVGTTKSGRKLFAVANDDEPQMTDAEKARKSLHDALDRQLDAKDQEENKKSEEEDAAYNTLKDMFKEKTDDAAHPDDCDCAECKDSASENEKEREKEETEATKDGEIVTTPNPLKGEEVPQSQFDAVNTFIRTFKPFVAKTSDAKLKKAFATACDAVKSAAKTEKRGSGGGDYTRVAAAARTAVGDAAFDESPAQKAARETDEMYKKEMEKRGTRNRAK